MFSWLLPVIIFPSESLTAAPTQNPEYGAYELAVASMAFSARIRLLAQSGQTVVLAVADFDFFLRHTGTFLSLHVNMTKSNTGEMCIPVYVVQTNIMFFND